MKKIIKILLLYLLLIFSGGSDSYAIGNVIPIPGVVVAGMTTTESKICQIRKLFCGSTAIVISAFSIFLMGILILNNKLHWASAIVLIAGVLFFNDARQVTKDIASGTFLIMLDNPQCDCRCAIDVMETFFNPSGVAQQVGNCAGAVVN